MEECHDTVAGGIEDVLFVLVGVAELITTSLSRCPLAKAQHQTRQLSLFGVRKRPDNFRVCVYGVGVEGLVPGVHRSKGKAQP